MLNNKIQELQESTQKIEHITNTADLTDKDTN